MTVNISLLLASLALSPAPVVSQPVSGPRLPGDVTIARPELKKPQPNFALRDPTEVYDGARTGTRGSASLWLPWFSARQQVEYEVLDGLAIVEGDIVLGPVAELAARYGTRPADPPPPPPGPDQPVEDSQYVTVGQPLAPRSNPKYYWEDGIIPYERRDNLTARDNQLIDDAIAMLHQNTNLRLVPRTGQADYVVFKHRAGGCSSPVGRQGGKQIIHLDDGFCGVVGSYVHEILHSAGVWHEHTRSDRNQWVKIEWSNIADRDGKGHNFDNKGGAVWNLGPYDYESVMHYNARAFGKPDGKGGIKPTIVALKPGGEKMGNRSKLSELDIRGINTMYPIGLDMSGGGDWGAGNYTTGIAFAQLDGDVRREIVVVRRTDVNARMYVFDDAAAGYRQIFAWTGGLSGDSYPTDLAVGDVDGDGRDEIGVALRARNGTTRVRVLDDRLASFATLFEDGKDWGDDYYATAIAFGDIDGDGKDELAYGRRATKKGRMRWQLRDDAATGFVALVDDGGKGWGDGNYPTDLAFGDADGDGKDEIALARHKNAKLDSFWVYRWQGGRLHQLTKGGGDWGADNYATAVAFGDIDGDGKAELAYGRRSPENHRWRVRDDATRGFAVLRSGGEDWGDSAYPTQLAFGNVDADGRQELGIARNNSSNSRYWVIDDASGNWGTVMAGGGPWGSSHYATSIALGDADADGRAEVAIGRKATSGKRYAVYQVRR